MRAIDPSALANALTAAGLSSTPAREGLSTQASPEQVGRAAAAAGVALVELRPADGAGLEDMFLELTAATQREETTPEGVTV